MAKLTATMSAKTDGIVALLDEVGLLIASRKVSAELHERLERFAQQTEPMCVLGEASLEDGHVMVAVHPSPEFLDVLQQLRDCEPIEAQSHTEAP